MKGNVVRPTRRNMNENHESHVVQPTLKNMNKNHEK